MLIKLFSLSRMINDPKPTQFIAWTELGTSFVVSIVEEFSNSVLGSHLEHNNVGFSGIRMWHEFIPPMGSSNSPTCGYGDYRLLKSSSLSWYHISVNHLFFDHRSFFPLEKTNKTPFGKHMEGTNQE